LKYFLRVKNNGSPDIAVDTNQTVPFVSAGYNSNCSPCTYTLSQNSYTCPNSNASTYSNIVNVTTPTGCSWTATVTNGSSWLSTTSSGNGNGSISITVQANTTTSSRTGTIDVNGQTLTITQPGVSCTYTLSQNSYTCPNSNASTYSNIVNVTAPTGCAWTATVTNGSSWLSTTSSGNGNGSISITVQANTAASGRTGTIDVSGQTLTVTQPGTQGGSCTYTLSQYTYTCSDASANTYNSIGLVNTQSGCSWQAIVTSGASWLASSSSGTGSGAVSIVVLQNTQTSARTGTIDINGQTLTITQPGASCSYNLSQSSFNCPDASANTYNNISLVNAQNGCSWSAAVTSGNSWLATSSAGNGSGSLSIIVLANNTGAVRSGTIEVNGQILTVTQPALTTSIEDISQVSFSVYPNPASNKLFLKCSNTGDCYGYQIRMVNTLGQQVLSQRLANGNQEIDVTTFAKGLYVIELLNEQNSIVGARQIVLE
jgi:hypothetical protein